MQKINRDQLIAKASELLDADYSFVAISGIGVAKSTDQNAGLVMSDIYIDDFTFLIR